MFSYFVAPAPQTSPPVVDVVEVSAAQSQVVAELAAKRIPRRGHLVVAGRYTNSRKLESEVAVKRTVLGEGMSSCVRLAQHHSSGRQFAVKSLSKDDLKGDRLAEVRTEVETHLTLDHPHIARLEQVYESDRDIHMVIEHLAGQELFDKIVQRGRFTEKEAADAMRQMLLAVQYMHGHGLVHRDLKPENFMYEAKGSDHLKLIDFGFARRFDSAKDENMTHLCGTLYYMAPEVVAESYTEKADMWSMGIILYTMLCGGVPWYQDDQKTMAKLKVGKPCYDPQRFGRLSLEVRKLIKSLLSFNPAKRPGATAALLDPWFQAAGAAKPSLSVDGSFLQRLKDFAQASPLQQTCATMAAWSCSREDQERMRDHFSAFGADECGALTSEVFTQAMRSANMEASEAEYLFRCLDLDGDNEIAFSEFIAGATIPEHLAADSLRLTFGRFDVDGDGNITTKDLKAVLGKSFFKKHDVEDLLLEIGDSEGAVSFETFSVFMRQCHGLPEEVNVACIVRDTSTSDSRSVSFTSVQSQDAEKSMQKLQCPNKPSNWQSGGKVLLGGSEFQPEKSAHVHATHSFSNQLCVS